MLGSKVSKDETCALTPKSFLEKMNLKFPTMNCSSKTNLALLHTPLRLMYVGYGFQ